MSTLFSLILSTSFTCVVPAYECAYAIDPYPLPRVTARLVLESIDRRFDVLIRFLSFFSFVFTFDTCCRYCRRSPFHPPLMLHLLFLRYYHRNLDMDPPLTLGEFLTLPANHCGRNHQDFLKEVQVCYVLLLVLTTYSPSAFRSTVAFNLEADKSGASMRLDMGHSMWIMYSGNFSVSSYYPVYLTGELPPFKCR